MDFSKLLVPEPEPLHISIAGLIGVGKSTLAQALAEHFHATLIKEPVEENPFLQEFYKEMAAQKGSSQMRTAFPLQMALLSQRTAAVKAHLNTSTTLINDRSPYEDAIFVRMLERSNMMNTAEAASYLQLFNTCFSLLPKPTVIVWLGASAETCLKRINKRGRDMESKISLDYLDQLDEAYEAFFTAMEGRIPILVVDWDNFVEPNTPDYKMEVLRIAESIQSFHAETQKKLFISD